MTTLMLYFILTAAGRWEFLTITRINAIEGSMTYCKQQQREVAKVFDNKPGNMLVFCEEDQEVET
jgi:hypothetical protein